MRVGGAGGQGDIHLSSGPGGGQGGAGGAGGTIRIGGSTKGADPPAVHLSSQGGHGGSGGRGIAASGGVGGNGGVGGDIRAWEVPGSGSVKLVTEGDRSSGLRFESAGGDGGGGGNSTCCNGSNAGNEGNGGAIALGHAEFSATLETRRDEASGVFVLSKGGTGGNGGDSHIAGAGKTGGGGGGGGGFFNPLTGGGGRTGASGPVAIDVGGSIGPG